MVILAVMVRMERVDRLKKREVLLSMEGPFDKGGRRDTHGVITKLTKCWISLWHLMTITGRTESTFVP